jgi:hypothetical protein
VPLNPSWEIDEWCSRVLCGILDLELVGWMQETDECLLLVKKEQGRIKWWWKEGRVDRSFIPGHDLFLLHDPRDLGFVRESLFYAISFAIHLDKSICFVSTSFNRIIQRGFYSNNNTLNQFNAAGSHKGYCKQHYTMDLVPSKQPEFSMQTAQLAHTALKIY